MIYEDKLVNRRLAAIYMPENDNEHLRIECQDGSWFVYRADGDCCSQSWIEHLEVPPNIAGATILSVHDSSDVSPFDGHVCTGYGGCGHDVLTVYNTVIRTDRGDIVIEYRNDSNGYYGGSLELEEEVVR